MAIKIVTGDQGKPHVTANDDGSFHQGVVGTEDYALGVGKKVKATLVSNNSVRIDDGELVMQGVHFRILPGTYENVTINNGNQGMKRKDLIVARYTKNSGSGIENITLAVLQGTPTSGTAVAPVPTTGDIRSGALKHEMPLYVVELNGLNVIGVDPVFEILMSMKEIKDGVADLNSKLFEQKVLWRGAEYMSDKQTATLSEKMSAQKHGVVLIFSFFENDSAQNYSFVHFFVPKEFLKLHLGAGSQFTMTWNSVITEKYLYFNDGSIKGAASNVNANNKRFVMRYVIGV